MTILFMGGELEDFTVGGTASAVANSTLSTAFHRSTYSRATLAVTGSANHAKAAFTASSQFSVTARWCPTGTFSTTTVFFYLSSGGSARLRLRTVTTAPTTIVLEKYDGATATTLATSTLTVAATLVRMDVIVDYQAAGRVRLYIDQVLYIDYSGDVTASGSTTLDGAHFGSHHTSGSGVSHWSEAIVCTQDSRTLSLVTLAPNAAGDTNTFTSGAYTDIDEITASDTDVAASATAGQVLTVNTTGMPSGWANLTVVAVKSTASAARGATGPSKLALGVRSGGSNHFEAGTTLDTGYSAAVVKIWELNPLTGIAWTTGEIDALQLAYQSEA